MKMNKIYLYLTILVSIVLFSACNLNESPKFDDKDAFVAFGGSAFSAKETDGVLKIPVRLSSLNNVSSTVTFEVIDSTAVSGTDYELAGGATVLNFDGSDPVQYIEFNILPHEGEFTGDRIFGIRLVSPGSVDMGNNDIVYVTILDTDHPLSDILGEYTGSGDDAWGGGIETWDGVVFEKDEKDVTKVWIKNAVFANPYVGRIYGVVNAEKTEISIPVPQEFGVSGSYSPRFNALIKEGPNTYSPVAEGEKLIFTINDGVIKINGDVDTGIIEVGVQAITTATGISAGWFERWGELTFTKK